VLYIRLKTTTSKTKGEKYNIKVKTIPDVSGDKKEERSLTDESK